MTPHVCPSIFFPSLKSILVLERAGDLSCKTHESDTVRTHVGMMPYVHVLTTQSGLLGKIIRNNHLAKPHAGAHGRRKIRRAYPNKRRNIPPEGSA